MVITLSKNRVPIRLNDERWAHITDEHGELAKLKALVLDVVANPTRVLAGGTDELLAVQEVETGKWLVVVYKEQGNDGFIITAFITRRIRSLNRRRQLWP